MDHAAIKYEVGMNEFVWKPGESIKEFVSIKVLQNAMKLQLLKSIAHEVKQVVKDDRLRQILEFPVLFLGATPQDTPALYSLMNHADLKLGTWYPQGGMYKIAEAFYTIAKEKGAKFIFNSEVKGFDIGSNSINLVKTDSRVYQADVVIANADYHHIDQNILPRKNANYSKEYWDNRKMAPSSLLVFVGIDKKIEGLDHHNLFFDADFDKHAVEIYKEPQWPSDPLFYVCRPSKTDSTVAPEGHDNLFLLMPIAPDLDDSNSAVMEEYFELMIKRIESYTKTSLKDNIVFKKFFSVKDFKSLYNSYKGNAYGLANTLMQTAVFKPSMKSRKINNLYYTGQLTVPGPGLPPSIISGQLAAQAVSKSFKI
jgi:phytoene desaturase